jgi:hypothetical protein
MDVIEAQRAIAIEEKKIVERLKYELNHVGDKNKIICAHENIQNLVTALIIICLFGVIMFIIFMAIKIEPGAVVFSIISAIPSVLLLFFIPSVSKKINIASENVKIKLEQLGVTNITLVYSCIFAPKDLEIDSITTQSQMLKQALLNYYPRNVVNV